MRRAENINSMITVTVQKQRVMRMEIRLLSGAMKMVLAFYPVQQVFWRGWPQDILSIVD